MRKTPFALRLARLAFPSILKSRFLCTIRYLSSSPTPLMLSALRFLTILPLPLHRPQKNHARWLTHHGWQATLVGLLIGAISAIPVLITSTILPPLLLAILAVVGSIILSGALHEDGLADTADSLGTTKEKRLHTMHDPHCGSFAVIALILSLAIRTTALAFLFKTGNLVIPLLLIHAAARSAFPLWCRLLSSHPQTSLARLLGNTTPNAFSVLSPLLVTAILAFAFLSPAHATIFLATFTTCSLLLLPLFKRLFKRLNGDLCGFGEQILECLLLLCLCSLRSI